MATFYHATFEENIPSILEKGLLPFFGGVYLTDSIQAACNWKWISAIAMGRDRIAVVAVDVDESQLEPGRTHAPIMEQISGGKSLVHREGISPDKIVDVMIMSPTEANPKRLSTEQMKERYKELFDGYGVSPASRLGHYMVSLRKGLSKRPKYDAEITEEDDYLSLHRWGKWSKDYEYEAGGNLDKWIFERKIEWPTKKSARIFATTFLDTLAKALGENYLYYDTSTDKIAWFYGSPRLGKSKIDYHAPSGYQAIREGLKRATAEGLKSDDVILEKGERNAITPRFYAKAIVPNIRKRSGTTTISVKDLPNFLKKASTVEIKQDYAGDEFIAFIIEVEGDYSKGYVDYRPTVTNDDLATVLGMNRKKILRQIEKGQTAQQTIDSSMVRIGVSPSGKVFGVIKQKKFEDGHDGLALTLEWEITTDNKGKTLGVGTEKYGYRGKRENYIIDDKKTYASRYNRKSSKNFVGSSIVTTGSSPERRLDNSSARIDPLSVEEGTCKRSRF